MDINFTYQILYAFEYKFDFFLHEFIIITQRQHCAALPLL